MDFLLKLDRRFLGAFVFPALGAVFFHLSLDAAGLLPWGGWVALRARPELAQPAWLLGAVAGMALGLALLLSVLQRGIVMTYEGYGWGKLWPFRRLTLRSRLKLLRSKRELERIRDRLASEPEGSPRHGALRERYNDIWIRVVDTYPTDPANVLPTRLGNAIRAFERYAWDRYGIESMLFWTRLWPTFPEAYKEQVSDAQAAFTMSLHVVFLLHLISLELVVAFLVTLSAAPLLAAAILLAVSRVVYEGAISQAIDWGYACNAGIDLYRRGYLRALELKPPADLDSERRLWERVTWFFAYGQPGGLRFTEPPRSKEGS
jgi:hypothetical protein